MKPKSAIEKGKRLENFVNNEIEAEGLGKAIRTPGSGSGKYKGDSFNNLDFLLEMKNEKRVNILKNIDQAKDQATKGNFDRHKWALVTRDPRYPEFEKVFVTIDFWEFLTLLKKNREPQVKDMDREMSYVVRNLIVWLKKLNKMIKIN